MNGSRVPRLKPHDVAHQFMIHLACMKDAQLPPLLITLCISTCVCTCIGNDLDQDKGLETNAWMLNTISVNTLAKDNGLHDGK